jgi:hypothetical protein
MGHGCPEGPLTSPLDGGSASSPSARPIPRVERRVVRKGRSPERRRVNLREAGRPQRASFHVARGDNNGWSLYGAPWLQPVATDGKSSFERKPQKRAKTVAVGCERLPRAAHGKEGVDGSSPSEGLAPGKGLRDERGPFRGLVSSLGQIWVRLRAESLRRFGRCPVRWRCRWTRHRGQGRCRGCGWRPSREHRTTLPSSKSFSSARPLLARAPRSTRRTP